MSEALLTVDYAPKHEACSSGDDIRRAATSQGGDASGAQQPSKAPTHDPADGLMLFAMGGFRRHSLRSRDTRRA